eukprot:COSAG02_NODE_10609_length_1901_cov_1.169256_3_plen_216_part_00
MNSRDFQTAPVKPSQCAEISRNKKGQKVLMEAQDNSPPPTKKRQLTQAQLDQLAKAREKANAVRKQNAQIKKDRKAKEKRLKELQQQVREEEIDEEIERYSAPKVAKPTTQTKATPQKVKTKTKQAKQAPEPYDYDSQSDDEDYDPREPFPSDDSSSSEEEPPPRRHVKRTKKSKSKPQRETQQYQQFQQYQAPDTYNHQLNRAFSSLFPNFNVQ